MSDSGHTATEVLCDPWLIAAPLVIGIVSQPYLHLADPDAFKKMVKQIFVKYRVEYPATPLILLTSRKGSSVPVAVQAAIDVAAEIEGSKPIARVVAVPDSEDDAEQYITRSCQILIVVQSAKNRDLRETDAGRAFELQMEGTAKSDPESLEPREGFPVYQLLIPDSYHRHDVAELINYPPPGTRAAEKLREQELKAEGSTEEMEKYFKKMFEDSEDFNAAIRKALCEDEDGKLNRGAKQGMADLLGGASVEKMPKLQQDWLTRYGYADALALRFQWRTNAGQFALHFLSFWVFVFFIIFAHFAEGKELGPRLSLVVSGVFLAVAVLVLKIFRKLDTRFQDYRALAEGLRVKFFWTTAEVDEQVVNHYFGLQRTELDWIRNGFRGWDLLAQLRSSDSRKKPDWDLIEFVHSQWIVSQNEYFQLAVKKNERNAELWEILVKAGATLAISAAIISWGCAWCGHPACLRPLIIAVDLFLAVAALGHHYAHVMAFTERAKQYTRMEMIYQEASRKIAIAIKDQDMNAALHWLVELGREALAENGHWVLLHRERPLEYPHT